MGLNVINLLFISLLSLASIQDFLKRSIHYIIPYLLLALAFSVNIHNLITGNISGNYLFAYYILFTFFLLYLLKFIAIGDLYIMFALFFFLSTLSSQQLSLFLKMLILLSAVFYGIKAIKIFYKNKEMKNLLSVTAILLLSISIGTLLLLISKNIVNLPNIPLIFDILIFLPIILLGKYNKRIQREMTCEISADKLAIGEWVKGEIEVKNIPQELLKEIRENFILERRGDSYVIKLKDYKNEGTKRKLLALALILIPFIFYNHASLFLISAMFVISLLMFVHNKLLREDLELSKKQIELLGKIINKDKKIVVVEGAPFIPILTLAYAISII